MSELINNPALLPPGTPGGPAPAQRSTTGRQQSTVGRAPTSAQGPSFAALLAHESATQGAPSFSKHAVERLSRRGVEMTSLTLGRLTEGVQRAAGKGARNAVVFVDGTAFVTSVQNNTVITAVTPEAMRSHVFTNIDSAVIA